MKKRLLSLFTVIAMLCTMCNIALAADGEILVPTMIDPFTYKNGSNGIGVVMICDMPDTAITSATVTLYDSSNTQVASQVYTEGNWVTAGARAFHSFLGLTANATYKAEITLSNGTDSKTTTVENIVAGNFRPAFSDDGYSFGKFAIEPGKSSTVVGLMSVQIDDEISYSGGSSAKYHSYGWYNTNGGTAPSNRYDWKNNALWANGMDFGFESDTYWEFSFAFTDNGTWDSTRPSAQNSTQKGTIDKFVDLTVQNMTKVSSSIEKQDNGWYLYKGVWTGTSATSTSIHPKITAPNGIDTYIWFDNFFIKKINDYNVETGEYSSLGNNVLYAGGFETKVENLSMIEEKVLTWTLPEGGWFAKLNIYKDGELIYTKDGTTNIVGANILTYTIPDEYWDIDSTYTVKVVPAAGGGHAYHNPYGTVEGPGVSIKGLSDIEIENYNGAVPTDAIATNSDDGVIDIIWNMPASTTPVIRTVAELIDADGDVVSSDIISTTAGAKNVWAKLEVTDKEAVYSARITAIYKDNSAGVATIDTIYADATRNQYQHVNGTNVFKKMVYGNWYTTPRSTSGRMIYDISYDTETKKDGYGSLKVDFRGFVTKNADTGVESFSNGTPPGNTYLELMSIGAVEANKYYEVTYTYKSTPRAGYSNDVAQPNFIAGSSSSARIGNTTEYVPVGKDGDNLIYKTTETDENGWITVKGVYKAAKTGSIYAGLFNEWNARRIIWLEGITVKEAEYDAENMTYSVIGKNILPGGELEFEVEDAVMTDDSGMGIIEWTVPYPEIVSTVRIYDTENNLLSECSVEQPYAFVEDSSKEYIIKVVTKNSSGTKVSEVETAGVSVVVSEPVPDTEIGEVNVSKEGTSATASVTVKNNKLDLFTACLILAEYDSTGKFIRMITDETSLTKGSAEETLTAGLTVGANNTVKAMLWDGLGTMKPID